MQKFGIFRRVVSVGVATAFALALGACASQKNGGSLPPSTSYGSQTTSPESYTYLIGPGDQVQIFVWRNPEISQGVVVRPDGKITTPLVEDLQASGKTPTQLARDLEKALETYIRQPIVTVIVAGGVGPYSEQIRVVGQASKPQAIAYKRQMTLLDVMIAVGGLTEFADGNSTKIVRIVDGKQTEYAVRVDDLLNDGDISANVDMLPGDILIIPESWF
ncbi:MAG: polysaccharide export protein [Candidatus Competibacter sp.]|nr:polysaccharide export protein [Candidatus Competibacter sp.]